MKGWFNEGDIDGNKKVELELHCLSIILFSQSCSSDFAPALHNSKATLGIESVIICRPVYLQTQLKSKDCRTLSLQLCDHYFPFSSNSNCQQNKKSRTVGAWRVKATVQLGDHRYKVMDKHTRICKKPMNKLQETK